MDRALDVAGVDRSEIYVTNVVKHFRFEERGKKRLHKKPTGPDRSVPTVAGRRAR